METNVRMKKLCPSSAGQINLNVCSLYLISSRMRFPVKHSEFAVKGRQMFGYDFICALVHCMSQAEGQKMTEHPFALENEQEMRFYC